MAEVTKIKLDRDYYIETFMQSYRYGSNRFWYERLFGILFLVVAVMMVTRSDKITATSCVLFLIGLYEVAGLYIKKFWWVNRQMKSKVANKEVVIKLTEEGIESSGPYSEAKMSWNGIERIVESDKGFLIWPQKGIHIYLPKSTVDSKSIEILRKKIAEHC